MQRENRRFEVIPNWPPDIPGHSGKSVASPLSPSPIVSAAAYGPNQLLTALSLSDGSDDPPSDAAWAPIDPVRAHHQGEDSSRGRGDREQKCPSR
jgi:hypothetical protein